MPGQSVATATEIATDKGIRPWDIAYPQLYECLHANTKW